MLDKLNRFNRVFNSAILFFVFSGGLYFLYYLLQFNKLIYLLFSALIYVVSFFIRHLLIKGKNKTGVTEAGNVEGQMDNRITRIKEILKDNDVVIAISSLIT